MQNLRAEVCPPHQGLMADAACQSGQCLAVLWAPQGLALPQACFHMGTATATLCGAGEILRLPDTARFPSHVLFKAKGPGLAAARLQQFVQL